MKPVILTDSGADIAPGSSGDLRVLPMQIFFGDEEYLDTVTLSRTDFYRKLIETSTLPTTSQLTPFVFERAFAAAAEEGRPVICITISQKLSGTYQSALMAARDYPGQVFLVDSASVTIGERILVEYALRLVNQGLEAGALVEELERVKGQICLIALLDTLEYLKAGRRISRTVALAGGLLNIKPVVSLSSGEVMLVGKARGSKNGGNLLRELIASRGGVDFSLPFCLGYTGLDDTVLRKYIEDNADLWQGRVEQLPIAMVGGTIGTHVGPGAIAVAFFAPE